MRWNCSVDKRGLESRIYYYLTTKFVFGLWNKYMASIIAPVGTCPLGNQGDSRVSDLASACQEPFLGTATLRASRDGPGI